MKSKYEFDESLIMPKLTFEERHNIIEGSDGVDEKIYSIRKTKKISDAELNELWWKIYKEILITKGYSIKE